MRLVSAVLVLAACFLLSPRLSFADWPFCGQAISTAADDQTHPAIAPDGQGGAFIAWQDHRDPKVNVFAQHVLGSGNIDVRWPFDGQATINDPSLAGAAGGNFAPRIVADGTGGAIVAWVDLRDVASNKLDIFAEHLLASGTADPLSPANGTALVSAVGLKNDMGMVPDGAGGAFVTWTDSRTGEFDVYAQHVLGTGRIDARWPANGLVVCNAPGLQELPVIVEDGAGGAIVTWDDARSATSGLDIFAQHVLVSGVVDPAWPANGRALCTAAGDQAGGTISSDGAHGAIVAWGDGRVVGTTHIFAEHVLASGVVDPAWPANGRAVSNASTTESRPRAIPDGTGGVVVTWQAVLAHLTLFAQHVTAAGVVDPAWPAGGRALSKNPRQPQLAEIVGDGLGGAVIAWEDSAHVLTQHVLGTGALDPGYPDTGREVCTQTSSQTDIALLGTGRAGAIVTWVDGRNGKDQDIYAVQLVEAGVLNVIAPTGPEFRFSPPNPNPARGSVTLRFALPHETPVTLAIYDAAGRRVRELETGVRPAGQYTIAWDLRGDDGHPVGAGIYLARLEAEGHMLNQKLVALR